MKTLFHLVTLALLMGSALFFSAAQAQERRSSFIDVQWENDAFQLRRRDISDRYFTNGVRINYWNKIWRKIPTSFLLINFGRGSDNLYGLSIGQEIYTPTNIEADSVLRDDRPYAGWLYLGHSLISNDPGREQRITSSLHLGVMGPYSLAAETQEWVHRQIDSPDPQGWGFQIKNDIGVNYHVKYEKRFLRQIHERFDLIQCVEGHIGTVTNFIGLGTMIRVGLFSDYFLNPTGLYDRNPQFETKQIERQQRFYEFDNLPQEERDQLETQYGDTANIPDEVLEQRIENLIKRQSNRKWQFYFFIQPMFRAVLDNSFLQGGVINGNESIHVISADELERFYAQVEYGGIISYGKCQIAFSQLFRTSEFSGAFNQQWGKLTLTVGW